MKRVELTTKRTEEFAAKVNQLMDLKKAYTKRQMEANSQIKALEEKLSKMTTNLVIEVDADKLEEISKECRNIRYKIDDIKLIENADIRDLLRDKIHELRNSQAAKLASEENSEYTKWHNDEIERIKLEADSRVKELEKESKDHPYRVAAQMLESLLFFTRK